MVKVEDVVRQILEADDKTIPSASLLKRIQPLVDLAESLEDAVTDLEEQLENARKQVTLGNAATLIQAGFRGARDREIVMSNKHFQEQGTRVLKKYLLKKDRVPGLHKLDTPNGDIAPNFRRLKGSPIYGGAQPSEDGIRYILDTVSSDGFTKVIWVNVREEAVVFVEGTPFTARPSGKLNENDLVPGMTDHSINVLETSLKNSLLERLAQSEYKFEYWHEPTLLCNELSTQVVDPTHVNTLPEVMAGVKHPGIESLTYHRAPIDRENFPEHDIVDQIVEWISKSDPNTAVVFNCQKGRGRTTTAMTLAYLIWSTPFQLRNPAPEISSAQPLRAVSMDPRIADYKQGLYKVILALRDKLANGVRSKEWIDQAIDENALIYHIRHVIDESRTKSLEEAKPARRSFYLHRACRLLERYFYFVVFGSYLLEAPTAESTFSSWLLGHPDLYRLLDTLGGATYPSSKVLHNNILKFDHFPGLHRLPLVLGPNVPNFRQLGTFPLFGTAQCFEQGIHDVLQHLKSIGHTKAIWINLREEVVMYVGAEYPGIEVNEITAIEAKLKKELIAKVTKSNGLFMHLHEPREYVTEESFDVISPERDVLTLEETYQAVCRAGYDVRYARIPVSDEIAPEEKDLDDLVRLLGPIFTSEIGSDNPTAIICNCQMGRGRTTTMLVCMYMLRAVITGAIPEKVEPKNRVHFAVIDELVSTLDNGKESLALVDHTVDLADHVQNLRDCIDSCRDLTKENGLSIEKQEFFMQRAVNYLERYFYLICFASYVLDEQPKGFQTLFVNWMCTRYDNALYALLDNLSFDDKNDDSVSSMRWRWRRKRKLVYRLE
ncbi:unnamed protein product [Aphanomyces euteiches]